MELKTTLSTQEMLEMSDSTRPVKKIIQKMVFYLQKYFGSEILLDVPAGLQDINPEIFPMLDLIEQLKLAGVVERVRKIAKLPDEPFVFRYVAFLEGVAISAGADFCSEKKALQKTLGEAVERYTWRGSDYFFLGKIRKTAYAKIKENALDIFSLAGFSAEQKKNWKILQFDEKTKFGWIPANSLVGAKQVFCPVQLLSAMYAKKYAKTPRHSERKEPMLRWCITTGVAAGQSVESALLSAILEIIERDAFMITYLNRIAPPQYDQESLSEDEEVGEILAKFKRYGLGVHLFHLPSDFPVFITLALIMDPSGVGPAVAVGASADFNLRDSILDALSECLSVSISLRNESDKEVGRINREGRLIYWAKAENLSKLDFLLKGKKEEVNWNEHRNFFALAQAKKTKTDTRKKLEILRKEFVKNKYELLWAEITSPEVEKNGFHVVSAVAPDLQPLHLDEEIPYRSGKRLTEVPKKLGYFAAEKLNQDPHPFP